MNNVENINIKSKNTRILIAPLDWGLGHATRCIPVIRMLVASGAEVLIAADGPTAALLKNEFPAIKILSLKGYKITYSRRAQWFFVKMLRQLPSITASIKYENKWLAKTIEDERIDCVISDNRFGFYNSKVPCIYITHQLFIETGNVLLNILAQKIHYRFINRFSTCWVPDAAGKPNLAGKLSHPQKKPAIPVKYIGCLSRFENKNISSSIGILILLSGPEPQRTIFENIILNELPLLQNISITIVRGLPGEVNELKNDHATIYNHLPADELNTAILSAETAICRAGYSSIMDLATLGKNAVLVPTPGQGEQEYLAAYLMKQQLFYSVPQQNFSLQKTLEEVKEFSFLKIEKIDGLQEDIIQKLVTKY